jgi:hypothetical protein
MTCGKIAGLDNSNLVLTCDMEVLMAVFVRIMVFWDVMPCSLVHASCGNITSPYLEQKSKQHDTLIPYTLSTLHNVILQLL